MTRVRTARGAGSAPGGAWHGGLRAAALLAVTLAALAGCSSGGGDDTTAAAATTTTAGRGSPASATTAATTSGTTPQSPTTTRRPPTGTTAGPQTLGPGPTTTSTLVPWDEPSVSVGGGGPTPSAAAGTADLKILLDDGFGVRAYWTLTCDPAGGSHPQPRVACGVLGAQGTKALPARSGQCADRYGGPQKARVTGTWRGRAVDSQFTLENGCEVDRWTAMIGLLPPGGV